MHREWFSRVEGIFNFDGFFASKSEFSKKPKAFKILMIVIRF